MCFSWARMMEPWKIVFFLYFLGLPSALWFALDARMAKLNPWVWALWAMLALFIPIVLIQNLIPILTEHGLSMSSLDQPWSRAANIVEAIVLVALVVLPIVTIYRRVLKPRRLEAIGESLNYVGGWLGTLIYALISSAMGSLVLYLLAAKKDIEYFCRDEKTWQSLFKCVVSFMPETLGTPLTIIWVIGSVISLICAALALIYKKSYAVPLTGYLILGLILLNLVYFVQGAARTGPAYSGSAAANVQARAVFINILLLAYLIWSRRTRQVYGRNFWRSHGSSMGAVSHYL